MSLPWKLIVAKPLPGVAKPVGYCVLTAKGPQPKFGQIAKRKISDEILTPMDTRKPNAGSELDMSVLNAETVSLLHGDLWQEYHTEKDCVRAAGAESVEAQELTVLKDGEPLDGPFTANLSPSGLCVSWGKVKYKYSGQGFEQNYWYMYEDKEDSLALPAVGDPPTAPWYPTFDEAWKAGVMLKGDVEKDLEKEIDTFEDLNKPGPKKEEGLFGKLLNGYVGMFW
eukprot:CAMPEP_0197864968 /NCGR_PEP_ID=MMETSP1438-20131217/43392_1 /TAXON_ID=1461541 /ORGANISM="Pterosperma sp., Strain CCMP1384" /LENGTH=224 /DNA_ID=CAMNT_0043483353 /DNA_START=219 /DNA_END=890 /DNA_ORIENTATION=+